MADVTGWTEADAARLAEAEAAFGRAGGRGVELAEEIDALKARRDAAAAEDVEYMVRWSVNMGGASHREAAAAALANLRDSLSDCLTFYVTGPDGRTLVVDLDGEPGNDYWDGPAPGEGGG
jgi:hypothetical protein